MAYSLALHSFSPGRPGYAATAHLGTNANFSTGVFLTGGRKSCIKPHPGGAKEWLTKAIVVFKILISKEIKPDPESLC